MSEHHSTPTYTRSKPAKPYPEFPLFAHAAGVWAKKVRGRLIYFGPWSDPDGALAKYLEQKDALHAGRKPREEPAAGGITVKELCNRFLSRKQELVDAGEITRRTWDEYKGTTDLLVQAFGKGRVVADLGPDDFAALRVRMARRWGPVRLGNEIQRVRSVFKFGVDERAASPVSFGQGFARPSKKVLRLERASKGPRMFEAAELRKVIDAAGVPLRAMILLGVNCGFGNADVATLPLAALDLDGGWVNYHRPKTGISRRCALWPETVDAIRAALAKRPGPKDAAHAGLVFVTKHGGSWFKDKPGQKPAGGSRPPAVTIDNPLSKEMRKLLRGLGIEGRRNFYALRHTFETIGGEAKDQVAVDAIMGHAREDMASVYRERVGDARLRAVADHVRAWLFGAVAKDSRQGESPNA